MEKKPTASPFFALSGVRTSFGDKAVLRGVDLTIPSGKTTVILGGSGAGKSVLLKHLNGLIRPDVGSVSVNGEEIQGMAEKELLTLRKRIGILFQDGALFDSMSVGENVAFPLLEQGWKESAEIDAAVTAALELVGLPGEKAKMPANLSGGMRKRASLARAMIFHPECLLCDEPTAGLDPILSETISHLIRSLVRERETTAVVVTHDLGAMRIMADHVIFLREGTVRFAGDLEAIEASEDEKIREFLSATGGGG
ncbi:MAG: ATP-binding cassette domain-containing protein [Verrucomicrobiales bacterium]|nr:ATP-binding cassette domain-containing protein [Verrucomicrobiales bacterium]